MENEYDPRCSNCHHYPWTDKFEDAHSRGGSIPCPCKCHNVPRRKRLMRFSLYEETTGHRDDWGHPIVKSSQHVMYVEKLAFCPFCKRSEFDDSVYSLINGHGGSVGSGNIRYKMNKDYSKDSDGLHYDNNEDVIRHKFGYLQLTSSCCGNHGHDWKKCKCGREICKVSFRECFGYEFNDELFENDFVDKSHYSEEAKALQAKDKWEDDDEETKEAVVPTFATMETIEKVWGKLPRERSDMMLTTEGNYTVSADGVTKYNNWNSSSDFLYHWQDEVTLPAALKVRQLGNEPWVPLYTPEEVAQMEKEAEERRKYIAEYHQIIVVRGIGEETAEKLFKKFKTADKVFSATAEQISKIPKLSKRAKSIRTALDNHKK